VTRVELIGPDGSATAVFSGVDTTSCGSALEVLVQPPVVAAGVRVSTLVSGYAEIDAVGLCGMDEPTPPPSPPLPPQTCQWATAALASSAYPGYEASKATGAPDVGTCSDNANAWAPATSSDMPDGQWLRVSYDNLMAVSRVLVHETYSAPFVTRVELIGPDGSATAVFSGVDTTSCGSALEVHVSPPVVAAAVRVDTYRHGRYQEIDAVQLCGEVVPWPPSPPPSPPAPPLAPPPCDSEIDLVLVVDNSGSVGGQRPAVLEFARAVVGFFTMGSSAAQIGFVEFDTNAVTHTYLTPDLGAITAAIDKAPPVGSGTWISGGLKLGQEVLMGANARDGVPKAIVLLTDGVQTVGGNDNTAIREAAAVKAIGTKIIAVGFGGVAPATLDAMASQPPSTYSLRADTAASLLQILSDGSFGICRIALDLPRGPPPSPPCRPRCCWPWGASPSPSCSPSGRRGNRTARPHWREAKMADGRAPRSCARASEVARAASLAQRLNSVESSNGGYDCPGCHSVLEDRGCRGTGCWFS